MKCERCGKENICNYTEQNLCLGCYWNYLDNLTYKEAKSKYGCIIIGSNSRYYLMINKLLKFNEKVIINKKNTKSKVQRFIVYNKMLKKFLENRKIRLFEFLCYLNDNRKENSLNNELKQELRIFYQDICYQYDKFGLDFLLIS